MYINKAIIYGNLTKDPEIKALPSGSKVCNFALATNRTWKDQSGKKQESVDYHNIVFFGKQAEVIAQWMHKGNALMVEGRISTRSWDGPDGKKNYRTEIVGENFQFGPKGGSLSSTASPSADAGSSSAPEVDTIEYPTEDLNPNDIPF